jgi:hypothetical protein
MLIVLPDKMKTKRQIAILILLLAAVSASGKLVLMLEQWLPRVSFCAVVETEARGKHPTRVVPQEVLRPRGRAGEPIRLPEWPQLLDLVADGRYLIIRRDGLWYGYRMTEEDGEWIIHSLPTKWETYKDFTLTEFRVLLTKHPYQREKRQNN